MRVDSIRINRSEWLIFRHTLRLVAFLPLLGASAWGETINTGDDTYPVTVYTRFEQKHSERLFETLRREVASIMAPVGLRFEWRSLEDPSHALSSELVVVSFKGACRMDELLLPHVDSGNLAWSYVNDGHLTPFSDVDCNLVREFINPAVIHGNWVDREAMLGRALGRVLAHELYHIFLDTKRHATGGVAKPFFTVHDLVEDHFNLQAKDAQALRGGRPHATKRSKRLSVPD